MEKQTAADCIDCGEHLPVRNRAPAQVRVRRPDPWAAQTPAPSPKFTDVIVQVAYRQRGRNERAREPESRLSPYFLANWPPTLVHCSPGTGIQEAAQAKPRQKGGSRKEERNMAREKK